MAIGDTKFGVQVSIGAIGQAVTYAVAFVGSIVLARVLGPDRFGSFYLLLALVAFLDNLVTGWATACRKRLTETDFPSGESLGSLLVAIALTSFLAVILASIAAPEIASFTSVSDAWILVSVLFVGMVLYHASNEVLKSTRRFGASPWLTAGRDVIRVGGQMALVLSGYGVAGMVGGMTVANVVVAPVVLYLIGIRPRIPTVASIRSVWSYARFSIPAGIVGTAQSRMDRLLLGLLASTTVVGNYEVALKLTLPAMFIAGVAQSGLMGRISNLESRDRSFAPDIQRNIGYASLVAIPLFFGALSLSEPLIVTVYSNQFAAAAPYLVGLALFRVIETQTSILEATINGLDRPDVNLRISGGTFVLNIVAGVGLFVAIGPIGVVVATVLSECVSYATRAFVVRSTVPSVKFVPRPLLDQFVCGLLMGLVVFGLRLTLRLPSWEYVIALVGLGALVYFAALLAISTEFRATVSAVLDDAGIA